MAAAEIVGGCSPNVRVAEFEPGPITSSELSSLQEVRILVITSTEEDGAALRQMLDEMPFHLTIAGTCREAASFLTSEQFGVVLCDCSLTDGSWIDILNQISSGSERPLLIVTSRLADDSLWSEVLNLGGYDLLATPFRRQEVRHVLTSAWVQRSNPVRLTRGAASK